MDLKTYIRINEIKLKDFAAKLGVDSTHLSRINNGKRRPSPELALKIEQATDKKVRKLELLYPKPKGK